MRTVRLFLCCSLALACSVSIFSSPSFAFDGKRKGFILGFGAGVGDLIPANGPLLDLPALGLQTDLKIGLGVNDRVLVHYTGKQFWHASHSDVAIDAFPLFGVTYFLKPAARSAFVSGGLGAGLIAAGDFEDSGGVSLGPAGYVGAGCEFARHLNLEFDVIGQSGGTDGISVVNLALTLNALAY